MPAVGVEQASTSGVAERDLLRGGQRRDDDSGFQFSVLGHGGPDRLEEELGYEIGLVTRCEDHPHGPVVARRVAEALLDLLYDRLCGRARRDDRNDYRSTHFRILSMNTS